MLTEQPVLASPTLPPSTPLANRHKVAIFGWSLSQHRRTSTWLENPTSSTLPTSMATKRSARNWCCIWCSIWWPVTPPIRTSNGCWTILVFTFCHRWIRMGMPCQRRELAMELKEGEFWKWIYIFFKLIAFFWIDTTPVVSISTVISPTTSSRTRNANSPKPMRSRSGSARFSLCWAVRCTAVLWWPVIRTTIRPMPVSVDFS